MLLSSPLAGASSFSPTSPASTATPAAAPRPSAPIGLEDIALHLFQLLYSAPLSLATLVRAGLLNDEAALLLRHREETASPAPSTDPSAAAAAPPPPPSSTRPLALSVSAVSALPGPRGSAAAAAASPSAAAGMDAVPRLLPPEAVARRLAVLYREHPLYELRDVLHREATRLGYAHYQDPASNDIVATAEALRQRERLVAAYTQLALVAHQQPGTPVARFPTLDAVCAAAVVTQDPEVATWAHGLHQLLGCHHQRERHCPHRRLDGRQRAAGAVGEGERDAAVAAPQHRSPATAASPGRRARLHPRALTRGETSVALRFVQQLQGSRPVALTRHRARPPASPPRVRGGEPPESFPGREGRGTAPPTAAGPHSRASAHQAAVTPPVAAAALTSLDCMNGLASEAYDGADAAAPPSRPRPAALAASSQADASGPAHVAWALPGAAAAAIAQTTSRSSRSRSRSSSSTTSTTSTTSVSLSVVGEDDDEESDDDVLLRGDESDEDDDADVDEMRRDAAHRDGADGNAGQRGATSTVPTATTRTAETAADGSAAAMARPTSAADPFTNRTVARLTAAVLAAAPTSQSSTATTAATGVSGETAARGPVRGFQSPGNPLLAGYSDTRPFVITELAPSTAADLLRLPYYAQDHEMNRLAGERGRSCYQDPHTGCLVLTSLFLSRLPHCYGEACAHCPHGEGCQRMQRHLLNGGGGGGGGRAAKGYGSPDDAVSPRTRHARRQRGRHGWVADMVGAGGGGGGGRASASDASSSDGDDPETLRVLAELDAEDGLGPAPSDRLAAAADFSSTPPRTSDRRRVDGGGLADVAGAGAGRAGRGRGRHVEVRSPASATSSVSAASFSDADDDDDDDEAAQQQRRLLLRATALSTYPAPAARNTAGLVVQVNSLRELLAWGGASGGSAAVGAASGAARHHAQPQPHHHHTHVHHRHHRRPPRASLAVGQRDGDAAARVAGTEPEPDWVDAEMDMEELLRRHEASLERFAFLDYAAL